MQRHFKTNLGNSNEKTVEKMMNNLATATSLHSRTNQHPAKALQTLSFPPPKIT
jgi:hypothetical protein